MAYKMCSFHCKIFRLFMGKNFKKECQILDKKLIDFPVNYLLFFAIVVS